ncbi:MFS transporter [Catellatospora coxensis]
MVGGAGVHVHQRGAQRRHERARSHRRRHHHRPVRLGHRAGREHRRHGRRGGAGAAGAVARPLLVGCVSTLAFALPTLALAELPTLPVLVACGFIAGFAVEQFAIAWDSALQRHVPADRLARVYSYDMLGSFLAMPVGQVAAGPLAEWIGTRNALLCSAGVMVLGVVGMLTNRGVRHLRADTPVTPTARVPEPAAA